MSRSPKDWGARQSASRTPNEFKGAFAQARRLMAEHQVPVVIEFILERVTNVSMGTEIDAVTEFEEILDVPAGAADAKERVLEPV